MTNWRIEESESSESYLEKPEVVVGDTIEIMSNNQLGYKKYKVILENGNKTLKTLADWEAEIYEGDTGEDVFDEADDVTVVGDNEISDGFDVDTQKIYGGKRYRKGRKSRKSRKSRK